MIMRFQTIEDEIRYALNAVENLPSYQDHIKNNAQRWLLYLLNELDQSRKQMKL